MIYYRLFAWCLEIYIIFALKSLNSCKNTQIITTQCVEKYDIMHNDFSATVFSADGESDEKKWNRNKQNDN